MIHKHRAEEFESRFKKAVSIVNRIPNYCKLDNAEELTVENYSRGTIINVLKKHLQVIKDSSGKSMFNSANPAYKNFNNTKTAGENGWFNDGAVVLNDGMTIFVDNGSNTILLSVDINGYQKKPNRWGYDLFTFALAQRADLYNESTIRGKGKVYPLGHPYTYITSNLCSKTDNSALNGATCAYEASKNPNYFKELL